MCICNTYQCITNVHSNSSNNANTLQSSETGHVIVGFTDEGAKAKNFMLIVQGDTAMKCQN